MWKRLFKHSKSQTVRTLRSRINRNKYVLIVNLAFAETFVVIEERSKYRLQGYLSYSKPLLKKKKKEKEKLYFKRIIFCFN